jgi:hypothetical protein
MRVGDFVTVNRTTQPNGPKVPLHDHQRPLRLDLSRPTLVFDRSEPTSHHFTQSTWSGCRTGPWRNGLVMRSRELEYSISTATDQAHRGYAQPVSLTSSAQHSLAVDSRLTQITSRFPPLDCSASDLPLSPRTERCRR